MKITLLGNKKLPLLEFIFVVYLFAVYLMPAVSMGSTTLLMVLLCYCAYLAIVDRTMFSPVAKTLLLIFVLAFFYAVLTDASSIAQNLANRGVRRFISKTYQYLTLYFPMILLLRVQKVATKRQKLLLVLVGVLMMIYVIITTWIFLQQNPDATRDWASFEDNSTQGVANYYFIYAVPIMISVAAVFMAESKNFAKVIAFGMIVAGVLFLVSAQYTLSILIAVLGVLFQILRNLRSAATKVFFVMALLLLALFLPQILDLVIANIASVQVTTRLGEVRDFLSGQGADGYSLSARLSLYWRSIEAFAKSPIWGNRTLDFDGHATFLTVLADTGLLGGIPFYVLLVTACKNVKSQLGKDRGQYGVIIAMFVAMGLTNPIHAAMPLGLTMWLLAPLSIRLIYKEDKQNGRNTVGER